MWECSASECDLGNLALNVINFAACNSYFGNSQVDVLGQFYKMGQRFMN